MKLDYNPKVSSGSTTSVIVIALLSERIAFHPVRNADPATLLITNFALSYLFQNILILIYCARPIGFNFLPGLGEPVLVGAVRIPQLNIMTVLIAGIMLEGVATSLRKSSVGV